MSSGDARNRERNAGFTLIEVLIAIVLAGVIGGVVVAALATTLNIAATTTEQVNESNDAGLISTFLFRDAQSAGAVNPATGLLDAAQGVSIDNTVAGWAGCTQSATMVVRMSWTDHASGTSESSSW